MPSIAFNDAQRAVLAKYFPDDAEIAALARCCEWAADAERCRRELPTNAEVKRALVGVADAAHVLACAIAGADSRTERELLAAFSTIGREPGRLDQLTEELLALSTNCDARADSIDRAVRQSPDGALQPIAAFCKARGIAISAGSNSKFRRIADVCFQAMGIPSGPHQAIKRCLEEEVRTRAAEP